MNFLLKYFLAFLLALITAFAPGCALPWEKQPSGSFSDRPLLIVRMLNIGQGDAFLLEKDGKFALIDSGDVDHRPQMDEYLKTYGVKELEAVIISHPHADHLGGMLAVFRGRNVKHIYDDGNGSDFYSWKTYRKIIEDRNIPYKAVAAGDIIPIFSGVELRVVAPVETLQANSESTFHNNNSVVGQLTYGKFSMLYTGDSETLEETSILKSNQDIRSTVLKVGHHGSRTASSDDFLAAVRPKEAFISCGVGNDYGHPHNAVLQRLQENRIRVYRTDRDGTVTLKTDGEKYHITKEY